MEDLHEAIRKIPLRRMIPLKFCFRPAGKHVFGVERTGEGKGYLLDDDRYQTKSVRIHFLLLL